MRESCVEKAREVTWLREYIATVNSSHFLFIHVVGYRKYYKLALITRKLGQTPLICESDLLKYNSEYHAAAALFGNVVC